MFRRQSNDLILRTPLFCGTSLWYAKDFALVESRSPYFIKVSSSVCHLFEFPLMNLCILMQDK